MRPQKEIETLLSRLQYRGTPQLRRRMQSHIAVAWRQGRSHIMNETGKRTSRAGTARFAGSRIMRNSMARFGVAAALLVAVLLGLHIFTGTSHVAWANVLAKVSAFDTYIFRSRVVETSGPRPDGFDFGSDSVSTVYYSEQYGRFSEDYRNDKLFARFYTLPDTNELVVICYSPNVYDRRELTASQIDEMRRNHPKRIVTKILEADYVELGEDRLEGKRVRGVELRDPSVMVDEGKETPSVDEFRARFWIDVETELPVWVEVEIAPAGSPKRQTVVWDQFQWGVPLAASLFEPNIPADFESIGSERTGRAYSDSTPRNEAEEAFLDNTQAEPYLSDFDHLTLPDVSGVTLLGVDTSVPQAELRLRDHEEVWQAQDAFRAKWPRYDDVRDQLAQELQAQLGIGQMTVEQLVGLGLALRERFWELRGCLSDTSYPYGYAARLVTAKAHELAPDDPAVTDQYVESIITCEATATFENQTSERTINPVYPGLLTQLRAAQFEQLKDKVKNGYVPTWKDFVRAIDLITLFDSYCEDQAAALEVTRWLITRAPIAGWTYYSDTSLPEREEAYAAGDGYRGGLFMHGPDAFPEEFRYARRLFSLQGPREHAQKLTPRHLRHLKGW
ncbi:MAG: hypothetical protein JW993_17645 [Sedimentisphaerales bacterium]|nr:hypothetical protein [Sedimentisphaerales bacterium]